MQDCHVGDYHYLQRTHTKEYEDRETSDKKLTLNESEKLLGVLCLKLLNKKIFTELSQRKKLNKSYLKFHIQHLTIIIHI